MDLSAPNDNDEDFSINELTDKNDFPLLYVTIDDVIDLIRKYEQGRL